MKGSRNIAALMLLSLALICFISAPALSIEDPWDVDGDDNNQGGMGSFGDQWLPDTSEIVLEDVLPFHGGTSSTTGWVWIDVTYTIAKQLLLGSNASVYQVSADMGGGTSAR